MLYETDNLKQIDYNRPSIHHQNLLHLFLEPIQLLLGEGGSDPEQVASPLLGHTLTFTGQI